MTKVIVTACLFVLFLFAGLTAQNPDNWSTTWKVGAMPFYTTTNGSEMHVVKAGFDTDQDGWGEFIASYCDMDSNFVLMYEATANDTYELVWYWKYPIPANSYNGIAVGDMDGSGVVDLIFTQSSIADATNPTPPRVWAFEWNGVVGENKYGDYSSGKCAPHSEWNFDIAENLDVRPFSLTIEDIDNDGTNELIVGVRQGDRGREVLVASVAGTFASGFVSWIVEYNLQGLSGGSQYSVTTGDLDHDGNREIHAFLWDLFTLRFIECTGDQQYTLAAELVQVTPDYDHGAYDGLAVADANNDGTNELYIASTGVSGDPRQLVYIMTGITDVSTITAADVQILYRIPTYGGGNLRNLVIADPDHDGNIDLMMTGKTAGQVYDMEYKGTGDPADSTSWDMKVIFDIYAECANDLGISVDSALSILSPNINYGYPAGDMDKDGKDEYVLVNYSSDFGAWPNDGTIWIVENGIASSVRFDGNAIPKKIVLGQNYPNPFNPTTRFSYALQRSGNVSVVIYDLLGKKVRTLVDSYQTAGSYSAEWDGFTDTGVEAASGTYIYKLKTNETEISKKMNLIR